jgi:hypothetical protein
VKKWLEYIFTGDYFFEENPWTESTCPWTIPGSIHHGPSMGGRPVLAETWPLAAPVLKCPSQGVEDGEMGSGNPLRASPEDEWWRGGRATEGNGW